MWIEILKNAVWLLVGSGLTLLVQLAIAARKRSRQGKPTGTLWARQVPTILLYVAIIGTLTGGVSSLRQANYAQCQAEVNQQFLEDIGTRSQIASDDRQAVRDLVKQVGEALQDAPSKQVGDIQAALGSFNEKSAANDAARPPLTATGDCDDQR